MAYRPIHIILNNGPVKNLLFNIVNTVLPEYEWQLLKCTKNLQILRHAEIDSRMLKHSGQQLHSG